MSNENIVYKVSLRYLRSNKEFEGEVVVDGKQKVFEGLLPGKYERRYTVPEGCRFIGKNPETIDCTDGIISLGLVSVNEKGEASDGKNNSTPEKPPTKAILFTAISLTLLSNLGAAEPFFQEVFKQPTTSGSTNSSAQNQPSNPSARSTAQEENLIRSQGLYDDTFSPRIETQLRQCIQSNFVRLSGIPTLSKLLASADWKEEPSGEFERQLLFLYQNEKALQSTIKSCNPSLAQQIVAANEKKHTVTVKGDLVNIRESPSGDATILGRVGIGTILVVDQEREFQLSFPDRLAIEQGNGWMPIFLPDGRRGYIYTLYINW